MATGFEKLPSKCTNFLHPTVDPNDRYDPTFLGVTRKAKLQPMIPEPMEDRGKRIRTDKQAHDPAVLHQDARLYKEPNTSSDVHVSRFGPGFSRRSGSLIQSDAPRKEQEATQKQRREEQTDARRVRLAGRNFSQYDPITGNPTTIGKHFPAAQPVANTQPELLHKAMRWPATRDSCVLPNTSLEVRTEAYRKAHPAAEGPNARQMRMMNDGLTSTKRDWSVAQQLKCNDGYVLPKV